MVKNTFSNTTKNQMGPFWINLDETLSVKQVEMKKPEVRIFSKMRRVKCVSKDLKIDSMFDTSSGNLCTKIVFIALNVIFTAIL